VQAKEIGQLVVKFVVVGEARTEELKRKYLPAKVAGVGGLTLREMRLGSLLFFFTSHRLANGR
jgi:hypothetical protein